MKENKIQPASLIITVIGIILIIIAVIWSGHHQSRFVPTPPPKAAAPTIGLQDLAPQATDTSNQQPVSICYALNNTTANGTDTVQLEITTVDGQTATGTFSTALAQKDASSGTLNGTLTATGTGAIFDGQYTSTQEGVNGSSEQLIELGQTEAKIGYGAMVPNNHGGYDYSTTPPKMP